jgi:hypothetical protein
MDEPITAAGLFETAMAWLLETYSSHHFFQERDIVWTLHLHLLRTIAARRLPFSIFSGHRMYPDRQLSADLVILGNSALVDVAVEFKYEPDHRRTDVAAPGARPKWPVVFWSAVAADVLRVQHFVRGERAQAAYAVFVDEGGYFRSRTPPAGSEWRDVPSAASLCRPRSMLWACAHTGVPIAPCAIVVM